MPTYDYRCPSGHEFEKFQRMSEEPVATCPECGEEAERVISGGAGFLFKGEGFYITDYRSEEYRKRASAEKESTGAGGSSTGSGAEKGSSGSGDGSSSAKAEGSGSSDRTGGGSADGSPGSSPGGSSSSSAPDA